MERTDSYWRLEQAAARLECGPLRGVVHLDRLGGGLLRCTWDGKPCDFNVLQLRLPLVESSPRKELIESYVRGTDLIATYERIAPLTVSPQIYWRTALHSHHHSVEIQVILSMHTDLLDSSPHSAVDSTGSRVELWRCPNLNLGKFIAFSADSGSRVVERTASQVWLFRDQERNLSYAEMVHPSDFESLEFDLRGATNGSYLVRSTLFPERLEKGVIRRARICGWFMPAENDLETAVELAKRFVAEPPPLTT